ncbi:hypothetical protein ACPV5U_24450 [Vibrio mediterranei]
MTRHVLKLYTDSTNLHRQGNQSIVAVKWKVDFNRELDRFLSKRNYNHDFDLLKEGVGILNIRLGLKGNWTDTQLLAYAESLAAKHVIANSGLNAFGFQVGDKGFVMTVRRDQLEIQTSQLATVNLLDRQGVDQSFFTEMGSISLATSPAAAYLYGTAVTKSKEHSWSEQEHLYINSTTDFDIRSAETIFTAIGEVIVDYRSVNEYMNQSWTRYQIEVKNQEMPRPFDNVVDAVKAATEVIYDGNSYLDKIRSKFGDKCYLLFDPRTRTSIPIAPIKHDSTELYHMLGMRRIIPREKLEDMHAHGYGKEIPLREKSETTSNAVVQKKTRKIRIPRNE